MSQYRHSISNFKFIGFYEYPKAVPTVGFLYLEKEGGKKLTVFRELTNLHLSGSLERRSK